MIWLKDREICRKERIETSRIGINQQVDFDCNKWIWIAQQVEKDRVNQHQDGTPGLGDLLAHTAIDTDFHERSGIPTKGTKIRARAAKKQALEIRGVSKGIYLRFPNIAENFFMKPLVVQNLSCNLNLGTQFNFKTGLIPLKVVQGEDRKKTNFSELNGIRI